MVKSCWETLVKKAKTETKYQDMEKHAHHGFCINAANGRGKCMHAMGLRIGAAPHLRKGDLHACFKDPAGLLEEHKKRNAMKTPYFLSAR